MISTKVRDQIIRRTKIWMSKKMNGNSYFESEGVNLAILAAAAALIAIFFFWIGLKINNCWEKWNISHYGDTSHKYRDISPADISYVLHI